MTPRSRSGAMNVYRTVVGVLVALAGLTAGGALMERAASAQEAGSFDREQLQRVTRIIEQRYVDPIAPDRLYRMAIDGMLGELGDPHTRMIDADSATELRITMTGNYAGLGIRVQQVDGWVTVMSVIAGTPAEREGILPGDRVVGVEGESVAGWEETRVIERLRGRAGDPVTVTVARFGLSEPLDLEVTRDSIHVPPVLAYREGDVGIVQLSQFSREARDELRGAIGELVAGGVARLVLDLRSNPGGLLEEGVWVADLFLSRGLPIVSTVSRVESESYEFDAEQDAAFPDIPLAVLIDGASASASEIVAGALQDHDRALVVGTPSFGKGSMQSVYRLPGGHHLKLTTAAWYTPSGRSIERERTEPVEAREASATAPDPAALDGIVPQVADTASREVFHTRAGRPVYGGGGIVPDRIVRDSLGVAARRLSTELKRNRLSIRQLAFRFAVRWTGEHPELSGDFEITPAMRTEFHELLRDEGVDVDEETYREVGPLIDRFLAVQLAAASFGELEALKRGHEHDPAFETAIRALRTAGSTAELLQLDGTAGP